MLRVLPIVAAVVGALWIESVVLTSCFEAARESNGALASVVPRRDVTSAYVAPFAIGGVASLAFVVLLVQALRFLVPRRRGDGR